MFGSYFLNRASGRPKTWRFVPAWSRSASTARWSSGRAWCAWSASARPSTSSGRV